jgi:cytochrome P450
MLNDPVVFLDPASFRPERFLEEKPTPEGGWTPRSLILAEDPIKIAFGFGRR